MEADPAEFSESPGWLEMSADMFRAAADLAVAMHAAFALFVVLGGSLVLR